MGVIIGPAADLRQLADYIETERASGVEASDRSRACTARRHVTSAAGDLTLDKFIDEATLAAAPVAARPSTGDPRPFC